MTIPMAMLIICTFAGANEYDCRPSEHFDTMEDCEEIALDLTEAKGLNSYCIEIDKTDRDYYADY